MGVEGGVKNSLDPSLGSQAPSMASAAVIWLQLRLTLEIDRDLGGLGPSKIGLVGCLFHDYLTEMYSSFFAVSLWES